MGGTGSRGIAPVTPAGAGGRRLARNNHGGVVLQLIEAAVGHYVSRADTCDLGYAAVCNPLGYAAHVRDIVLNQIDKRRLPIVLNSRRRNQRHSLQRVHQEPRIDKLVRKEGVVLVGELGPAFYSPGGSVDQIVDRQQRPAAKLRQGGAVES